MHISDHGINPVSSNLPVDNVVKVEKEARENVGSNAASDSSARLELSDLAKDFSKAVQKLEKEEEVRPDKLEEARAALRDFSPTDEQIDVILNKIIPETRG